MSKPVCSESSLPRSQPHSEVPACPPLEPNTRCVCGDVATEQWYPNVCAMEGQSIRWMPVCAECDVRLNEFTVRTVFGVRPETEALLKAYRSKHAPSYDASVDEVAEVIAEGDNLWFHKISERARDDYRDRANAILDTIRRRRGANEGDPASETDAFNRGLPRAIKRVGEVARKLTDTATSGEVDDKLAHKVWLDYCGSGGHGAQKMKRAINLNLASLTPRSTGGEG